MATQQLAAYNTVSIEAGEDLSAKQFRFVKINSSGKAVLCGTGEQGVGVLLNKPESGYVAEIQIGGIAKVEVDAAVTAGDRLMSSSDGQAATKTGTNNSMGIALETASTAATRISVKLDQSDGVAGGGVGSFENTAITPSVRLALLTVDGTDALTLADGTIPGQTITMIVIAATNTPVGTLTMNDAYTGESATIVFRNTGEQVTLTWTTAGWKLIEAQGAETISSAGALEPVFPTSYLSVDGTKAYTLAAGTRIGQRKLVQCVAGTNTPLGTLTIADCYGAERTAWVFTNAGQAISLEWTSTGWKLLQAIQAGSETVAAAGTANPLCLVHLVTVGDTVDFIQEAPEFAGQRSIWFGVAVAGAAVATVSGLFYDEDGSADGIDLNMNAVGDMAVLDSAGSRWLATSLVSVTVST